MEANVTPVFKKGSKSNPPSYRPVNLTVNICNILESLLKDNIVDHLEKHALINETQHGFIKSRSCLTNLLVLWKK